MTSDEQTRTAPRTAAGRALVRRLYGVHMRRGDDGSIEMRGFLWDEHDALVADILAIEAEAAASREVPPEPPALDDEGLPQMPASHWYRQGWQAGYAAGLRFGEDVSGGAAVSQSDSLDVEPAIDHKEDESHE